MIDRANRTFISSVLFLDIVEYTRQPVAQQIRLKNQFNSLVSELIADISESDRIILDTGDGAALSFLGDPEDALFVAVKLRDALREKQKQEFPDLHIRMGINLGPVKLLKDINGRPNLIGDGINVAQRVMSFANPDQILVSRSFFEVVSCLSTEYSQLFNYQGTQKDKHVREHELYEIGFSDKPLPNAPSQSSTQMVPKMSREDLPPPPAGWDLATLEPIENALADYVGALAKGLVRVQAAKTKDAAALRDALAQQIPSADDRAAFLAKTAAVAAATKPAAAPKTQAHVEPRPLETIAVPAVVPKAATPKRSLNMKMVAAAGTALVVVIALLALLMGRSQPKPESKVIASGSIQPASPPVVANNAEAPAAAPATPSVTDESPKAEEPQKSDKKAAEAHKKVVPKKAAPVVAEVKPAAPAAPAPSPKAAPVAAAAPVVKPGFIVFQVNAAAELWVDGVKIGDSNSMKRYGVKPGTHRVEVRHCGFPPQDFISNIDVVSDGSSPMMARCSSS